MEWIRNGYSSLDEERVTAVRFWSKIAKLAIEQEATTVELDVHRKYVLDRASWAATEVRPSARWKLFRQRYWSRGALTWAEATLPLLTSQTARDAAAQKNLRHEHVHERSETIEVLLASGGDLAIIETTLQALAACVVTTVEATRLDRSRARGWARYSDKNVEVVDLETGNMHPLPARPNVLVARRPGRTAVAEETLDVMGELQQLDGEEAFARLHHQQGAFWTHWDYCQETAVRAEGSNADTLQRIKIAISHFREYRDWDAAVRVAWDQVPKSTK